MPSGVGATTIVNDPSAGALPFVVDPGAFFDLTERNVYSAINFAAPGSGNQVHKQLPQAGILGSMRVTFVGTLTCTLGAGSVTSAAHWPYGLIDLLAISLNAQADVWSVRGSDLHALRAVRFPGFQAGDSADTYSGSIGPGSAIATGATDLVLTWDVPIAIDPVTLIGNVYLQSPAMNVMLKLRQAVTTDLLVAAGGATIDSLTGTFYVELETFDIPLSPGDHPALVVPDQSRMHAVQGHAAVNFTNTGEVRAPVIRGNGQLDRLMVQVSSAAVPDTSADAFYRADADLSEIDALRLEYGNAQRPLDYNPASLLLTRNIDHYQAPVPYGFLVFDLLAENPPRDIIQMQGITDLVAIPTIDAAAGAPVAGANVRLVQEMLIG